MSIPARVLSVRSITPGMKLRRKGNARYDAEVMTVHHWLGSVYYIVKQPGWSGRVSEKTLSRKWEIEP